MIASCGAAAGDLAHNPGMGPDWESNLQPFGSQASTQSTEPHQPGFYATFNLEYFPCLFLLFHDLEILKSPGQIFKECPTV